MLNNRATDILRQGVAAVDAEVRTGDVLGRVAEQEGDGAHEVFGGTHLTDGDEGGPLVAELGVFIENFAGAIRKKSLVNLIFDTKIQQWVRVSLTAQSAYTPD